MTVPDDLMPGAPRPRPARPVWMAGAHDADDLLRAIAKERKRRKTKVLVKEAGRVIDAEPKPAPAGRAALDRARAAVALMSPEEQASAVRLARRRLGRTEY